ncbi:hypothetical protein LC653_43940, partial [Nostoc sp. CHAB 5784]|uniref:hypothetical protein n=1 Tax=Nostoc mirabile TaxID=2907820 RepID=UPI001E3D3C57
LILRGQLSHSILVFKTTVFRQKSTYIGIHHRAIAKLFGLLNFTTSVINSALLGLFAWLSLNSSS